MKRSNEEKEAEAEAIRIGIRVISIMSLFICEFTAF